MVEAYVKSDPYEGFPSFGYDLNALLRTKPWQQIPPAVQATVRTLDGLFSNTATSDLILYRGTSYEALGAFVSGTCVGPYPAYMSTSRSLGAAAVFVETKVRHGEEKLLLRIIYTRGKSFIDAPDFNSEAEVLLPRNCCFRMSQWNATDDEARDIGLLCPGVRTMELHLLPCILMAVPR